MKKLLIILFFLILMSCSQKKVENWLILMKKHKFPYNLWFFIVNSETLDVFDYCVIVFYWKKT